MGNNESHETNFLDSTPRPSLLVNEQENLSPSFEYFSFESFEEQNIRSSTLHLLEENQTLLLYDRQESFFNNEELGSNQIFNEGALKSFPSLPKHEGCIQDGKSPPSKPDLLKKRSLSTTMDLDPNEKSIVSDEKSSLESPPTKNVEQFVEKLYKHKLMFKEKIGHVKEYWNDERDEISIFIKDSAKKTSVLKASKKIKKTNRKLNYFQYSAIFRKSRKIIGIEDSLLCQSSKNSGRRPLKGNTF